MWASKRIGTAVLAAAALTAVAGCRSSDLLRVPPPANLISGTQLGDSAGAEALRGGAIAEFTSAFDGFGLIAWSVLLSDEVRIGYNYNPPDVAVDARIIQPNTPTSFDGTYISLQESRLSALQAAAALEHSGAPQTEIGQLFALTGYAEVLIGEAVCPGSPLSSVDPTNGAVTYGQPLPSDSVFARALTHFDSALAHAGSDPVIAGLAAVGQGRAFVDRGDFAHAGAAVGGIAPTFQYGTQMANTTLGFYANWARIPSYYTVGDRKGGNGLDFVSAKDPRIPILTQGTTVAGLPAYYPLKFPPNPSAGDSVPLADGVEAQLIVAEAALSGGDAGTWLATLNGLRANFVALRGPYPADTSYHPLAPLADPGSDSARVSLMFRERAFWLYGTAHRLGDLRRLIRQYGRTANQVYPTGPYDDGTNSALFPTYGTAVNFPIGIIEQSNPNFHGCSSTTA